MSNAKEQIVPIAGYADKEAKLALLFGKWWKHYIDSLSYLDELRFAEQRFFLFPVPSEGQLSEGRDEGMNKLDVELSLPVKLIASKELVSQEVYDVLLLHVTQYYLSRGLDDLQESVPPSYRVAAVSDVSYIDKSSTMAFPKRAALKVEEEAAKIIERLKAKAMEDRKGAKSS